mmetsp:Transcript_36657/g.60220  ORF Transcript_36657/g.60220 Transcript_36657/m.60220 type:complete len:108 (-) Transcript_36657:71-394(-)
MLHSLILITPLTLGSLLQVEPAKVGSKVAAAARQKLQNPDHPQAFYFYFLSLSTSIHATPCYTATVIFLSHTLMRCAPRLEAKRFSTRGGSAESLIHSLSLPLLMHF